LAGYAVCVDTTPEARLNATALSDFLSSMDGIAYATDPEGRIVAYGGSRWDEFAATNGASHLLQSNAIVGCSVLDVIVGTQVRAAYQRFMTSLATNRVDSIRFSYRCDGPGSGRAMHMSITRLLWNGAPSGFLFQSTAVDQGGVCAPLPYLHAGYRHVAADENDVDAAKLCSFCQRMCPVGSSRDDPESWTYDPPVARGDYLIAHAVCPRCEERVHVLAGDRAGAPDLSRRQREVLAMLVRGHPNKTICAKLGMSPNTVKTHLRVIFRELQATNRTEAATEALRRWPDCAAAVGSSGRPDLP
jgi:DNA-binding CsgD family transcriptional regulator